MNPQKELQERVEDTLHPENEHAEITFKEEEYLNCQAIFTEMLHSGCKESLDIIPQLQALTTMHEMPEVALICSKYFLKLSKFCFTFYQNEISRVRFRKEATSSEENQPFRSIIPPPTKALTPYIIYFQERSKVYANKYRGQPTVELTRMIGKEWNNLPQEQRKPYLLKATNERKRYERETEEYRAKLTQNRKEQERQRKSDLQQEREGIRSIGQIDKDCKASELSQK